MLDTICDVLKHSYQRGWISTRDGNASFRRAAENHMYITPSGVRKQNLYPELFIKLEFTPEEDTEIKRDLKLPWENVRRIEDDYSVNAVGLNPSGELPLHYLLQRNIKANQVVLHLHPTHIISAMYAGLDLQYIAQEFPEINRYSRVGPSVPQIEPISGALGLAVEKAMEGSDIVGMDRHGVVAVGQTAWEAFEHIERLEHVCQIVLGANL
jgi:ribulose-5-phosphate 4-epimerase/fuculose-1-phosphate aldolase